MLIFEMGTNVLKTKDTKDIYKFLLCIRACCLNITWRRLKVFDRLDFCVWTIHISPSLAHIIGHDINMGMISFGS